MMQSSILLESDNYWYELSLDKPTLQLFPEALY
jgi:hypothetical protein